MYKMLLGILIMFSQLSIEAFGCNARTLDSEAEAWVSKTWSKTSFNENQIKESLIFLDPSEDFSKTLSQYLDKSKFDIFCSEIHDQRLHKFVDLCKNIYKEDNDIDKISIFMLLVSVVEKYDFIFKKSESLKPKKESDNSTPTPSTSSVSLLDMFFNADRNIRVQ